jgi:hypothetical protein
MPLAESADDQAVIRGADVELRQHLPAPSLESRLEVMCAVRDLCRVGSGALGVFRGVGPQCAVPGRHLKHLRLREGRRRAERQRQRCEKQRKSGAIGHTIPAPDERRDAFS